MKLYLFDDGRADDWAPFALTRPIGELRYGASLLRERAERWAGVRVAAHLTRPWLGSFREPGAPPVVTPESIDTGEERLLLSSRFVPAGAAPRRSDGAGGRGGDGPGRPGADFRRASGDAATLLVVGGRPVGLRLPPGEPTPGREWLRSPAALPGSEERTVEGEVLERSWDLVRGNPDRLARDVAAAAGDAPVAPLPDGVHRLGDGPVRLGAGVVLEPGVVLDTRESGVWLDEGVEVRAGCRLEGPLYAGPRSLLLGGPLSALSAGPFSYVRGEVEETVVLGHANKAHSGFLGHAYLGRWVNLGASTTNSDLKNNYGPVRVGPPGAEEDTGLIKLGCLLGDHVKTGIGTMLNTGTVVGAGSNVFGGAMPPKWVPPFSWGAGSGLSEYRRDAFLETAGTVMGRRGVELDEAGRRWLGAVWDEGRRRADR